jgi:hypothetical protein
MKITHLITLTVALSLGIVAQAAIDQKSASNYKTLGQNFLEKTSKNSFQDRKEIDSSAGSLIEAGKVVIGELSAKYPKCKGFLDKVVADLPKMQKLSHEAIESQYHKGAALPATESFCNELKELVVHPATVIVLNREAKQIDAETLTHMSAEIDEVMTHIDNIEALLAVEETRTPLNN